MNLLSQRLYDDNDATISILSIDDDLECFVLEDEPREVKVHGETRIPAGCYEIKFRKVDSGKTLSYRKRFSWFTYHLELQKVPNFEYIYIHIGNTDKDTLGCLLTGRNPAISNGRLVLEQSTQAFESVYKKVSAALKRNEKVWITIFD